MEKRKRFFEHFDKKADSAKEKEPKKKKARKVNPLADKILVEAKLKPSKENATKLSIAKYARGTHSHAKGLKDKKLKSQLESKEKLFSESALTAAKFEKWLLPSEGGLLEADGVEETYEYGQDAIVREVDITSKRKAFDLKLPDLGPYTIDYTNNGRYLLLGGRKGHLALVDWKSSRLVMETMVKETTRDVRFLHNEQFFAAAQKKYIYIYNKKGLEIHCLKEHMFPIKLEFLRHHFLLVSINQSGILHYQDTSTGQIVADHRTKVGVCGAIRANPYNGVVSLGQSNGTVSMWSPNMKSPLVTMLCHRGPVVSIAFDSGGYHMVTAGSDSRIKVWDVRKYQELHNYYTFTSPKSVDVSGRGLIAVGFGSEIEVWKDGLKEKQEQPYMKHSLARRPFVQDMVFCPYEDVLGIGHSEGFSSMLVPGSGEPNYDSYVANPYETAKQRREAEVHYLLDKLQPEMIMLNPDKIGCVQREPVVKLEGREAREAVEAEVEEAAKAVKEMKMKKKTKGRNKPTKQQSKKQIAVFNVKRAIVRQHQHQHQHQQQQSDKQTVDVPRALARFM